VKVLRGPYRDWERPTTGTVVSIGVYDGLHLGHQAVIRRAQEMGNGRPDVVLTFARHPATVLLPGSAPPLLTTTRQKLGMLRDLGVEIAAFLDFDDEMRLMPAVEFVRSVVVDSLHADVVVVGEDFRFGANRGGDVAMLRELGPDYGFKTESVALEGAGRPISSTDIRRHLAAGEPEPAALLLGRPYEIEAHVVPGEGRGKSIGIPTANLDVDPDQLVPKRGVYAVMAKIHEDWLPGVANVGFRPTFGGELEVVEVHLPGFDADLYGELVAVQFRSRIRDERKFGGVEELVAQIRRDIDEALKRLKEASTSG
jgi:riboflavin kinase/FMN adenylyltransferase